MPTMLAQVSEHRLLDGLPCCLLLKYIGVALVVLIRPCLPVWEQRKGRKVFSNT